MESQEHSSLASLSFGEMLQTLRKRQGIRQQALAEQLGIHRNTIGVWERGDILPNSKTIVLELARKLYLDSQETRLLLEASLTALAPRWYVPYPRNPYFIGREDTLQRLHDVLAQKQTTRSTQVYALNGLGGIGKTQTAVEYAYRYVYEYAAIFWLEAETSESLVSSFIALAEVLNLPEKQAQEQVKVVAAVLRWLTTHRAWLLIFDNVEDLGLIKRFLPTTPHGSVLLTTRIQALGGLTQSLELPPLTVEEGMHVLLQRTGLRKIEEPESYSLPADYAVAETIHDLVGGLPLALDQAGAYVEEIRCSLECPVLKILQRLAKT